MQRILKNPFLLPSSFRFLNDVENAEAEPTYSNVTRNDHRVESSQTIGYGFIGRAEAMATFLTHVGQCDALGAPATPGVSASQALGGTETEAGLSFRVRAARISR